MNKSFSISVFSISLISLVIVIKWLVTPSEADKAKEFYSSYQQLTLRQEYEKAKDLHLKVLRQNQNPSLDIVWLPLVRRLPNGYDKLFNYLRILRANPNRKEVYEELGTILKSSPEEFMQSGFGIYLNELENIEGIHQVYIDRYVSQIDIEERSKPEQKFD